MITGELKNKIDQLWEMLWTEGNANPLTNIEQLTYLLFMKDLDRVELGRENDAEFLGIPYEGIFPKDKPEYRWSTFKNLGDAQEVYRLMSQEIFPFIKNLKGDTDDTAFSRYMREAIFQINKPATLQKVISILDEFPTKGSDMEFYSDKQSINDIGDIYEYLLSKLSQAGANGQFRTPRHIIDMMVELIDPDKTDKILDPACGTAGFLISAYSWIKKKHIEKERLNSEDIEKIHRNFYGFDIEPNMTRIARVNLFLHGFKSPHIIEHDTLSSEDYWDDRYDVIIANPPFATPKGGVIPHKKFGITSNRTELLFVDYIASHLKPNGRAAVIVPDGVLFGSSSAHKALRKEIVENKKLQAVISMPSGVFKPYAGVSTAILVFTNSNNERTDKVWFYDMKVDGYSLDDKRSKLKTSDIPDILARFKNLDGEKDRKRNEQSFFVDKEEIVKNGYDLTINKYKEVEYEKVEYPPTSEIIAEIKKLDREASESLAELEKLLNETNPDL